MLERVVVDPRQVPHEIRDEPHAATRRAAGSRPGRRAPPEHRRDREDEQPRRPLREHDVLEQVRPEERVQRERLELGEERGEDQRERGGRGDDAEAARALGARDECVAECERRHEGDGLRREMHGATLAGRAGVAQGRVTRASKPRTRVRLLRPLALPEQPDFDVQVSRSGTTATSVNAGSLKASPRAARARRRARGRARSASRFTGTATTNAIARPTPRLHQKSAVGEPGSDRARHEEDEAVVDELHHRDRDACRMRTRARRAPERHAGAQHRRAASARSRRRTRARSRRAIERLAPAERSREDHAEHLADRAARQAVHRRLDGRPRERRHRRYRVLAKRWTACEELGGLLVRLLRVARCERAGDAVLDVLFEHLDRRPPRARCRRRRAA